MENQEITLFRVRVSLTIKDGFKETLSIYKGKDTGKRIKLHSVNTSGSSTHDDINKLFKKERLNQLEGLSTSYLHHSYAVFCFYKDLESSRDKIIERLRQDIQNQKEQTDILFQKSMEAIYEN